MNTINIDYRQLPDALREAGANLAISEVKAGTSEAEVAQKFCTTKLTIHRWVGQGDEVKFKHRGRPNEKPVTEDTKVKHSKPTEIDYRVLPEALRTAARLAAIAKVKAGETITSVASQFGTTFLSVSHWVNTEGQEPKKRGRKPSNKPVVETTPKKRGRPPKIRPEVATAV